MEENVKVIKRPASKFIYYINKEKGTIVAKMINCQQDLTNMISRNYKKSFNSKVFCGLLYEFLLNSEYTGKAKLCPGDSWNEELGMKIARNRALRKYYRDKKRLLEWYTKCETNFLNRLFLEEDYCEKKLLQTYNFIN